MDSAAILPASIFEGDSRLAEIPLAPEIVIQSRLCRKRQTDTIQSRAGILGFHQLKGDGHETRTRRIRHEPARLRRTPYSHQAPLRRYLSRQGSPHRRRRGRKNREKDACWIASPIQYPRFPFPSQGKDLPSRYAARRGILPRHDCQGPRRSTHFRLFNNRKAYAERFIEQMKDRIREITRTPRFPMKDMPEETVLSPLGKARYITGASYFTGEGSILCESPYKESLQKM